MSDNVIRPDQWIRNGEASLETETETETEFAELAERLGGGGVGPHDPGMEQRVATLEADMKGMSASLNRIETTLAVVAEGIKALATKAEVVAVTGSVNILSANVSALDGRVVKVESAMKDTIGAALAKSIGPWQVPAILGACIGVVAAGIAVVGWILRQPWFVH